MIQMNSVDGWYDYSTVDIDVYNIVIIIVNLAVVLLGLTGSVISWQSL